MSIRKEQITVKAGTLVQGAGYIHEYKPLFSMETIKHNYDLQFANRLSSYLVIAMYNLRPRQISSNATGSPACFGLGTKKRPR